MTELNVELSRVAAAHYRNHPMVFAFGAVPQLACVRIMGDRRQYERLSVAAQMANEPADQLSLQSLIFEQFLVICALSKSELLRPSGQITEQASIYCCLLSV